MPNAKGRGGPLTQGHAAGTKNPQQYKKGKTDALISRSGFKLDESVGKSAYPGERTRLSRNAETCKHRKGGGGNLRTRLLKTPRSKGPPAAGWAQGNNSTKTPNASQKDRE